MEVNWINIRNEIRAEVKDIFSPDSNFKIDDIIDLFIKVILYPIDDKQLDGISTRMPNSMQKILIDNISRVDKNSYFPDIAKVEPYFRKLLYLINYESYNKVIENRSGLGVIIDMLELNPNNINLNWSSLHSYQKVHYGEHLLKSYQLRNIESHQCNEWNNVKLYKELSSALVMYLYATSLHFEKLKGIVEPNDFTDYLNGQSQIFKIWQSRFVHIEGKEEFAEVELYVKEISDDISNEDNVENYAFARKGKIQDLRKTIDENQMIILGDVGMGKTTTLQYIHFKDSQLALKDKNELIPIYFELKNFTSKDEFVQKIADKTEKETYLIKNMLEVGKFSICLDGLNEIEKTIKPTVFIKIKNLLTNYPKNHFIITSRPQSYNREFDDILLKRKIPVFVLQKMHDDQISDFLDKNGRANKIYIEGEIQANVRLKKIIQTPLMLTMLIAVVQRDGKIPNEKGKIIRAFMFSLYKREQNQEINFDKDIFHLLLCYLGYQSRDLTGSNSGLDRDEYILPILEERKAQLGININLLDFLRKAIDLNIFVEEDNYYSFTHELYQEYYAAEFIHQFRKSL